ncbi:MAG TPA: F0F1 ATP synthase subunit epsilon [Steroidobacteraceae bacterium]
MRLIVTTPLATVVEIEGATYVRAEDPSGAFGILPGHADFLTALAVSVLTWREAQRREHHVAVRGGVLSVRGGNGVSVATPEAVLGDDLHQLESEVLARFRQQLEAERAAHTEAQRLHLAAIRQIMRLLRPESSHAARPG